MSNVLAYINTSLLQNYFFYFGTPGGKGQVVMDRRPSQLPESLSTLQLQLLPLVTHSDSVDPLLWASSTERRSSSPDSRDFAASNVSAHSRSHCHHQKSTECRDHPGSTSSY